VAACAPPPKPSEPDPHAQPRHLLRPTLKEAAVIQRRTLVITDPARADLDGIYDHIAADSPESAERFITRLIAQLHRIARIGVTGVARDGLRPGLRMHPFGRYCAYFRVTDDHLVIVRIVHSARDVDAISFESEI
jgi:toxin ParE1/3/4